MPPRHPQIPGEVVFCQETEAVPPPRVLHATRLSAHAVTRTFRDDRFRPDATHQRKGLLADDYLLAVWFVDPRMSNDRVRHPMRGRNAGQPLGLLDLTASIAFCFDVHRGYHVVEGCVAPIFG